MGRDMKEIEQDGQKSPNCEQTRSPVTQGNANYQLRDRSQTLVRGGPDAKRGALKIFDPCKGGPEKNYHRFISSIKN